MIEIDASIRIQALESRLAALWRLATPKVLRLCDADDPKRGTPVYTVNGRYTSRGWTEWTQGFVYGAALLVFDATGNEDALERGRTLTNTRMAPHLTHMGVHDHGFNNVSTYGNLRRLTLEGRVPFDSTELVTYENALRVSGAVQASRWTRTSDGRGFVYSFNGPHSLFADTLRSMRSLMLAHLLGHELFAEHDQRISLLSRAMDHAATTAQYTVYYGEGRDHYDVRGRVAHESLFNTNDGVYRAPSTQQGYSPFTTWTRGLAWVMLGFAELLEFLELMEPFMNGEIGDGTAARDLMLEAAKATCDFYISNTPTDGIPYWDTGAPGLSSLGDYLEVPADPFNSHEPVDSSAAAIASQGLMRLGRLLATDGDPLADQYFKAGLTTLRTLLSDTYLSTDEGHDGLLLHTVYHRPNGWDHIHEGQSVPNGESVLWGDYHLLEASLYVQRLIEGGPYYTFFGPVEVTK